MVDEAQTTTDQLRALSAHLERRREAILTSWETAVASDPELRIASSVSLLHFRDLMPDVLKSFEARLKAAGREEAALAEELAEEETERVIAHGVHRWQQGYSLRELVREWNHFQLCGLAELERYTQAHPDVEPGVMVQARRLWIEICGEGVGESVEQYARLREQEATGIYQDLKTALAERRRAATWHEAAHDLRGNVGLVASSTSLLTEEGVPEALRNKALTVLQSSVSSLHRLLEELMDLARLEAGRELRKVEPLDGAGLLRSLAARLEPVARERGLFLETEGAASLPVEGDAAKVERIVQNLALNALKYVERGGVTLAWGETWERETERWWIRIDDTGPGLPQVPAVEDLREATDIARGVEEKAGDRRKAEPIPEGEPGAPVEGEARPGEGIGLSIVKRLCELLEAGLEVASRPGEGTTFRVILPKRYDGANSVLRRKREKGKQC